MSDSRAGLHILVVAPGRHPAEAVERAMARLREERRIPHEIHVVAPRERLAELQRGLLGSGAGAARFAEACAAAGFHRDEILFNQRTLHVIGANPGADCSAEADRMLAMLRQLLSSEDSWLTMVLCEDAGAGGYVLQAAAQIAGRIQDRLLVDVWMPSGRKRGAAAGGTAEDCRYLLPPTREELAAWSEVVMEVVEATEREWR